MVMDDRGSTDALEFLHIELLNVLCGQILESNLLFTEIRCDDPFDRGRVRSKCRDCNRAFDNVEPLFHVVREQDVPVHDLRLFGIEIASRIHQDCFGAFFVSLNSKSGRNPLGLSFSERIGVVQHGVVISAFFAEMSCYHNYPPSL